MENIFKVTEERITISGFEKLPKRFTIAFLPHNITIFPEWLPEELIYPWHFTLEREDDVVKINDPYIFHEFRRMVFGDGSDVKEFESEFTYIKLDDNRDAYIIAKPVHDASSFFKS